MAGVGKKAASANVAIIEMLRKMDAAAALAKRCITLSMPPYSVTIVISSR
jgi:hypothetical protein